MSGDAVPEGETVGREVAGGEVPLGGGRWTAGVVRVGETVRRPAVDFTGRLLVSLATQGFDGCPRFLGRDDAGRDVLSFVAGEVPARWRRFEGGQVAAAARLLRGMHDASRDLAAEVGGGEVVCHHDPGPNNAIFRDGLPVAFIDFDFAAPGDPLEDVAYLAWSWCISSRPDREPPAAQAAQVRLLSDAYGLTPAQRTVFPGAIEARIRRNEAFWRAVHQRGRPGDRESGHPASAAPARIGETAEARLIREAGREAIARAQETAEWSRREAGFVAAHRAIFAAALGSRQEC